jgi:hypothetical protein
MCVQVLISFMYIIMTMSMIAFVFLRNWDVECELILL